MLEIIKFKKKISKTFDISIDKLEILGTKKNTIKYKNNIYRSLDLIKSNLTSDNFFNNNEFKLFVEKLFKENKKLLLELGLKDKPKLDINKFKYTQWEKDIVKLSKESKHILNCEIKNDILKTSFIDNNIIINYKDINRKKLLELLEHIYNDSKRILGYHYYLRDFVGQIAEINNKYVLIDHKHISYDPFQNFELMLLQLWIPGHQKLKITDKYPKNYYYDIEVYDDHDFTLYDLTTKDRKIYELFN